MNEKVSILAIILTFASYFISNFPNIDFNRFDSIQIGLINYVGMFLIVLVFRNVIIERKITEELNRELKKVNLTLKQYSAEIEEFTIAKERTRIAQELHDSIGHSLIALKMNLEYAESVLEAKPQKAKDVIHKAQIISKDCLDNLRKAVNILKEDRSMGKLREVIMELFENFKETSSIKVTLEMENTIQKVSPDIKNCVYKTIREGVTNGIKHGNATTFTIIIYITQDMLHLKINNNGLECMDMNKSNGTHGIEERIKALGGTVEFISDKDMGFDKDSPSNEIIDSIKTACEGNILLNPNITLKVIKALNIFSLKKDFEPEISKGESLLHLLTQRELEVTEYIIKGKSNKAISKDMFVTEGTIKNYVSKILEKLELNNRAELMLYLQKFK